MKALVALLTALAAFGAAWGIPSDLALWYESPVALAGVVAALTALIRKHLWKAEGPLGMALSAALGLALAYLGNLAGHVAGDWLTFGLLAGVLASGGVDLVRSLGGNRAPSQPAPGPGPDVDRSRLR